MLFWCYLSLLFENIIPMKYPRLFLVLLFAGSFLVSAEAQQIQIGQWRDELPYSQAISIAEAGSRIYAATPYAVFYYDKDDNSIQRLTKITGLSDVGVTCIAYSSNYQTVIVAYTNANIDLIKGNSIINISDIKRAPILGNKTINNVYCSGKYAYLSCGFGIVVMDIDKEEIKDTYYIGEEGSPINVLDLVLGPGDTIYAGTATGLYKAWSKDPNLANYANWHLDQNLDANASYPNVTGNTDTVFIHQYFPISKKDSLYYSSGSQWISWTLHPDKKIIDIRVAYNYIVIAYQYFVEIHYKNLVYLASVYDYFPGSPVPLTGVADKDQNIWIGDTYSCLIRDDLKMNHISGISLQGPFTADVFSMSSRNNDLYIAPGGRDPSYVPVYNMGAVYYFDNTNWINSTSWTTTGLQGVNDIVTIAIDPADSKHIFAGSWGKGLVEMQGPNVVRRYTENNSTLHHHSSTSDTSDIRVGGTAFDGNRNLWVCTTHTNSCLSQKQGSQWYGYTIPIVNEADLGQMIVDKNKQCWIVMRYTNQNPNSLLVFSDNGTPGNPSDDNYKKLNSAVGNGAIPGTSVFAIAEDLEGQIWIGTEKGVAVFYNPENVFTGQNFDAQQPLVQQGGYVQYLLENETATAIAVDGANRKWIGTDRGGVYLFSPDGTQQVYHFTIDDSPLFSNRITGIAINNETGEVYFGTDKGIISFKSTATEGGESNSNVYAYPNPVKSGYTGYIAIKGLVKNAVVKITDVSGNLIYSTVAEGGQAIWNGNNFDGRRANTGVYIVFAANNDGSEKIVTRILIVN